MTNVFDFDELGNFTRLGDCFSGGQKVLPFCLHTDGVADFAKPSVSGARTVARAVIGRSGQIKCPS